jgi:hypothetical protein
MLTATCHCGAVRIEMSRLPAHLTECNCSMCRKLGTRWAYYTRDEVAFRFVPGATVGYSHGEKTLEVHHCRVCGCTTHWRSISPEAPDRVAINARLVEPKDLEGVEIRRFDGADTWTYLS